MNDKAERKKKLACQECGRPIRRHEARAQSAGDKMPTCMECLERRRTGVSANVAVEKADSNEHATPDPNGRVTLAILKAELALDDAIRAWEEVERAEAAVAAEEQASILRAWGDLDESDFLSLSIAHRGGGSARVMLRVLRAFRGREP